MIIAGGFQYDFLVDENTVVSSKGYYDGFVYMKSFKDATGLTNSGINNRNFDVFPNPSNSDQLTISEFDQLYIGAQLEILNSSGTLVQRTTLQDNSIDISGLNPGYYIIFISQNGEFSTSRFVKQ